MKHMRIFLIINALLALSIGMIGCDNDSSSSSKVSQPPFEGAWQLVSMNGQPMTLARPITANFSNNIVDGFSGCNLYRGGYLYYSNGMNGSRLFVSNTLATTAMSCESEAMQLETDYLRILQTPLADEYDGGSNLTLRSGNEQLVYVRE